MHLAVGCRNSCADLCTFGMSFYRATLELQQSEKASTARAVEEVAQWEHTISHKLDAASKRATELKAQQEELKQAEDTDEQHVQVRPVAQYRGIVCPKQRSSSRRNMQYHLGLFQPLFLL